MLARFNHHFVGIIWHLRALYLMLLALIMAGAVAISATEKVSFGKAVYFAFITGLTVGYGDIVPSTAIGQIIAVLLALVGILFTGVVVAVAVQSVRYAWEETQSQGKQNQD
ncbi:MAG: two pore domain potassium channel family protein [Deltaproteobacteria bacterium]|nr:MAG: two pore domain potassium channel family protein [Deltaproteobacteria bacterium]